MWFFFGAALRLRSGTGPTARTDVRASDAIYTKYNNQKQQSDFQWGLRGVKLETNTLLLTTFKKNLCISENCSIFVREYTRARIIIILPNEHETVHKSIIIHNSRSLVATLLGMTT